MAIVRHPGRVCQTDKENQYDVVMPARLILVEAKTCGSEKKQVQKAVVYERRTQVDKLIRDP
ncbi:hypothetical protein E2C01_011518 [Portunus trituberculatus]|uniref:Uncharacterized protein n=1 Tax=Portunus trituberculatus TaxID=210409 RepID=A0A5B7DB88_PORTR|nr:hypothetical protein [Portunus trituberculatus]